MFNDKINVIIMPQIEIISNIKDIITNDDNDEQNDSVFAALGEVGIDGNGGCCIFFVIIFGDKVFWNASTDSTE